MVRKRDAGPTFGYSRYVLRVLVALATGRPEFSAYGAETTQMRGQLRLPGYSVGLVALAIVAIADCGSARAQSPPSPPSTGRVPDGFVVTPPRSNPQLLPPRMHEHGQDARPDDLPERQLQPHGGCSYQEQTLELIV